MIRRKRFFWLSAAAIVLVAAAATFFIPVNAYRAQLEAAASRATGRPVQIAGDLHFALFPEIGLSAKGVSVANPAGARDRVMFSVDTVIVGAKLRALLAGRLEITHVVLRKPIIHLETAKDGTANWASLATQSGQAGNASTTAPAASGNVRVMGGQLSYYDAATGTSTMLENVDASLAAAPNGALSLDGNADYKGKRFGVKAQVDDLRALSKTGSKVAAAFSSDLGHANFDGDFAARGSAKGALTFDTPSLRTFAQWADYPLPVDGMFERAKLSGNVDWRNDRLSLSDLTAAIDGNLASGTMEIEKQRITLSGFKASWKGSTISGDITLDNSGAKLVARGTIAIDSFDADSYFTVGKSTPRAPTDGNAADTVPIDLGMLKTANADVTISIGRLVAQKIRFQNANLHLTLNDGLLTAAIARVSLYGGTGNGTAVLDGRGAVPTFHNILHFADVDTAGLLDDFVGVKRIGGKGTLDADIAATGANERALLHGLSGKVCFALRDGTIQGVDLPQIARTLQTVTNVLGVSAANTDTTAGANAGNQAQTQFSTMTGNFTLANGVAHNTDFHLTNAVVQVAGHGDIDLANRTLDFHLVPKAVALRGRIGVPFHVYGPWTKPGYVPDVKGIAAEAVKTLAKDPLKALKNPGQALKSLFGLGK